MIKGINYWAFPLQEDGSPPDLIQSIRYAGSLGYDSFEPTVDEAGSLTPESTEKNVRAIARAAKDAGLAIPTVASGLAWSSSPTHPDPDVRSRAIENTRSILRIAAWLEAKTVLYIPGMVSAVFVPDYPAQPYEAVHDRAIQAMDAILPTAEELGITIAVENVWNRFLLSPMEMRRFIDSFGSPYVGSYFDTGNALLYGHPEDWIRCLGERIKAVHAKDFRVDVGNLSGFVDLLAGDLDVDAVLVALTEVGYKGPLTIEYVPPTLGAAEKGIAALNLIEQKYEASGKVRQND